MDDTQAMRRAVELSWPVLGGTSPNPPVGAVVLDQHGGVVGEGATRPPGGPHAERVALAQAGVRGYGGTVVTTLEPCAHIGRTGPCVLAIVEAGIRRVVLGHPDPTELGGGGAELLRAAGVEVTELAPTGPDPLEAWLHRQRTGRPLVTWKYAATLDGRSAAADGTSRWITGEAARADVHRLRAESDAVMVGVGTVLADDPQLTVRPSVLSEHGGSEHGDGRYGDGRHGDLQPLRVVLDRSGRTPADARVHPALVLAQAPDEVLAELARRDVVAVLLEGGPTLAAAFLQAGLVDRVIGYLAPALLGDGAHALSDIGVGTISDAVRLRLEEVTRLGEDLRLTLSPRPRRRA